MNLPHEVYIAATATRLPRLFQPEESVNALYPSAAGDLAHRLALKMAKTIGIRHRPSVLDPARWPERIRAREEDHPVRWCADLAQELGAAAGGPGALGHLSVAYNASSDPDVLPSVSARVASRLGLDLERPPDERPFLGCAGALFSVQDAFQYCRQSQRAAVACAFDQCSWLVKAVSDTKAPDFGDHLRTSLIFGDGAAGLLLVPAALRDRLRGPAARLVDVRTGFIPGGSVRMEGGHLLLGKELKDEMPEAVSKRLVLPMLERRGLRPGDVDEWSIHQGGLPILSRFAAPEALGLSEEALAPSRELFLEYGNFSAPSCLFVLDRFFRLAAAGARRPGRRGVVVSFGAGYYLGAMLYEWA
ncbi:MAG TPA: 3-oxoacyl-[acyl-carrier-protein] synthase III C-terminal domain-containing protein [Myxococcales bacterium]|jgi:predicted naringenin-chalcone synthase